METHKLYPISKLDTDDTKIELTCRATRTIIVYFEEKYGREKLEEFIYDTKMNLEYLEDQNNWISYKYFCRLLAKLVEYTNDPQAPFIAGTYSTKKQCYGMVESFITRFATPSSLYKLLAETSKRHAKIADIKIIDCKKTSCTFIFHYHKDYKQDKNNCLNIQGMLASVPPFWNLPLAKVKHIQCAINGGDTCVYQLSWQSRISYFEGVIGFLLGMLIGVLIKILFKLENSIIIVISSALLGSLLDIVIAYKNALKNSLEINEKESSDLVKSFETIEQLNIDLQKKVEQRTAELDTSNKQLAKTLDRLKKSQDKLIQSEKMASVGRLAAGMAHELNNPVGAIRNYIQDVLEDTSHDDPRWERLKMAEKATSRCKRIVSDLLTFARENKEIKIIDVNSIIETTITHAQEEIPNVKIKIVKDLAPALPKIKADNMQLQQTVMNMIMNARDAIENEGQIIIKTFQDSENIIIEISDTGTGIPDEIQDKIFDPFFTTKAPGKGQGLGLAISYNIIKRFNGDIRLKSKEGEGTTFTIVLPIDGKEI